MAKTNKKINKLRKRKTSRKIKRRLSKKRLSKKRFNRTRKRGGNFRSPSSIEGKFVRADEKGWDAVRIEEEIEKLEKMVEEKDKYLKNLTDKHGNHQESVGSDDWIAEKEETLKTINNLKEQLQASLKKHNLKKHNLKKHNFLSHPIL